MVACRPLAAALSAGAHEPFVAGKQLFACFHAARIIGDALHRTHLVALRFAEVAHAFGAAFGIDDVNLRAHGDGVVGAFRLAHIAIDACVGDHEGHGKTVRVRPPGISCRPPPCAEPPCAANEARPWAARND